MYSRDFGGIKSDGQLYRMEQEYNSAPREEIQSPEKCEKREEMPRRGSFDFLRDLKLDDLILIAIGILLLLDGENENDIFVFLIAFLLFF